MINRTILTKLAGGVAAIGIAGASLLGSAGPAAADCGTPPCINLNSPGAQQFNKAMRPDLVTSNLTATRLNNQSVQFSFTVKNQGVLMQSGPSVAMLHIDGLAEQYFFVNALPAGASQTFTYTKQIPATAANHWVGIMVDIEDSVDETHEDNNWLKRDFK